jgi:hypothetical protein
MLCSHSVQEGLCTETQPTCRSDRLANSPHCRYAV